MNTNYIVNYLDLRKAVATYLSQTILRLLKFDTIGPNVSYPFNFKALAGELIATRRRQLYPHYIMLHFFFTEAQEQMSLSRRLGSV